MMPISKLISIQALIIALICLVNLANIEAKLIRRSRYHDDYPGSYDGPYGMGGATGERVMLTVRGARNPYDGSAPSKIAIEDQPHRGYYPRGVYDRLDSHRSPMMHRPDFGYNSGYGASGTTTKRRDFLDPDFGVRASLNLAGSKKRRSKCRVGGEADSEIPALGLDGARLNIDCDINPTRVANAAIRAAQSFNNYRRNRRNKKQTRINVDAKYVRTNSAHDGEDEEDD